MANAEGKWPRYQRPRSGKGPERTVGCFWGNSAGPLTCFPCWPSGTSLVLGDKQVACRPALCTHLHGYREKVGVTVGKGELLPGLTVSGRSLLTGRRRGLRGELGRSPERTALSWCLFPKRHRHLDWPVLAANRLHLLPCSSGTSTALVKSLEDRDKAPPEVRGGSAAWLCPARPGEPCAYQGGVVLAPAPASHSSCVSARGAVAGTEPGSGLSPLD